MSTTSATPGRWTMVQWDGPNKNVGDMLIPGWRVIASEPGWLHVEPLNVRRRVLTKDAPSAAPKKLAMPAATP